ncbi:MAG: hypothetical protein SO108_00275 [Bacilli bacterium]|nr:hypothetical protein [Bacilli bacterium]
MQEISEEEVKATIDNITILQDEINETMDSIQKSISEIIDQTEILKINWTTDGGIKSINQIKNTLEEVGDLSSKKVAVLDDKINYTTINIME